MLNHCLNHCLNVIIPSQNKQKGIFVLHSHWSIVTEVSLVSAVARLGLNSNYKPVFLIGYLNTWSNLFYHIKCNASICCHYKLVITKFIHAGYTG